MARSMTRAVAAALSVALVMLGGVAHPGPLERAGVATAYVASQQQPDGSIPSTFGSPLASTSDAVLAFVVARTGAVEVQAALDNLEADVSDATTIGLMAKVAMAAVAGGRDPRSFGGRDLIGDIAGSEQPDGKLGADSSVFDHALGMLALAGAGEPVSGSVVDWLARAQCGDGGWQFDGPPGPNNNARCKTRGDDSDFSQSDTNSTALAIQALAANPTSVPLGADPFRYLKRRQDPIRKGWGFDRSFSLTDAVSTALVLQAYAADGRTPPPHALRALKALQYRRCGREGGAFAFTWIGVANGDVKYHKSERDLGATVAAIPGMLQQPFPIAPAPFLAPPPDQKAC